MSIIKNQLPDSEKINLSNFVIISNKLTEMEVKSLAIHNEIVNNLKNY